MASKSRTKGRRGENEVRKAAESAGLNAVTTAPMQTAGADFPDVLIDTADGRKRIEVKRRARIGNLYEWIAGNDAVALRADNRHWLVVVDMGEYLNMLKRLEEKSVIAEK